MARLARRKERVLVEIDEIPEAIEDIWDE